MNKIKYKMKEIFLKINNKYFLLKMLKIYKIKIINQRLKKTVKKFFNKNRSIRRIKNLIL